MGLLGTLFGGGDTENTGMWDDFGTRLALSSQAAVALDQGKQADIGGALMQANMLRQARRDKNKITAAAKRYADKIRGSNPELADFIDADPSMISQIAGKQLDYAMDPNRLFMQQLLGGGSGTSPLGTPLGMPNMGGVTPTPPSAGAPGAAAGGAAGGSPTPPQAGPGGDLVARLGKASGIPDLTPPEAQMLAFAANGGQAAFGNAISKIIDDRRQNAAFQQSVNEKQQKLQSVKPFIEELRKTNPALASAYEQNPDQAIEEMQSREREAYKKQELQAKPEYKTWSSVFEAEKPADPNVTFGIPAMTPEEVAQMKAAGPEQVDETTAEILKRRKDEKKARDAEAKAELKAAADAKEAARKEGDHKAEQDQQTNEFKIRTAMGLSDDYDRNNKAYVKVMDVGRRTQELIKNPGKRNGAEQMQVIYDFVKTLDADSAVKEGETAMTQQIGSYFGRIANIKDKADSGSLAPEEAVRQMEAQIMELAKFADERMYYNKQVYSDRAKQYKIDPSMVFGPSNVDMSGYKPTFDPTPELNPLPALPKLTGE